MLTRPAVIIQEGVAIPEAVLGDLAAFREWTLAPEFPTVGRIDYVQGNVEVDLTPEDLQNHGVPKTKLAAYVLGLVEAGDLGQVFTDSTRLMNVEAGLSCEPDVVFVSWEALDSGRASYGNPPEKLIEIQGTATLVIEIVSDSSVHKDQQRLPPLYARAGVDELWLLDARPPVIRFDILHLKESQWQPAPVDADGYQQSQVLGRRLRLRREPARRAGTWRYIVEERQP